MEKVEMSLNILHFLRKTKLGKIFINVNTTPDKVVSVEIVQ